MGVIVANDRAAVAIGSGMHGSTFGGGPLACRVALEFMDILDELLPHIEKMGFYFRAGLEALRFKLEACECLARHDARCDFGDRKPDHLGDERYRSRGARIDLEHIDIAVLDSVLHIHQTADLEREGEPPGLVLEFGDRFGAERTRRQRAGAVAGMDAGLLDMLHHAGDDRRPAVGEGVDVDLDRIRQVAVE